MADHLKTGSRGEQLACDYLISLGYHIIDRNFKVPFGEIDIVSRDSEGTLVIVEVKTVSSFGNIFPEDNLTRPKFHKLSRVAAFYANAHPALVSPDLGFQIDLLAIILNPTIGTQGIQHIGKNYFAVSHYKNISL